MAAELLMRVYAEVEARMAELRPAVDEYEQLLGAAGVLEHEAAARPRRAARPRQGRLGASEQAIVAALEHGSHTVAELGVVTAMAGAEIRRSVSRLLRTGRIVRASREGRSAYALSETA